MNSIVIIDLMQRKYEQRQSVKYFKWKLDRSYDAII